MRFKQLILIFFTINSSVLFGQKTLGLITSKKGSVSDGYVLFAPLHSRTTYLIDKCGNQINSWKSNHLPGYSAYLLPDGGLLRTGVVVDSFFRFSGKGGIIEKYDWNGKLVWSYIISNDSLSQHHDICPMRNGNILIIAWHGIPTGKAESFARLPGSVGGAFLASERIIEIKPIGTNEAEVVWQWSLWDHVAQDVDSSKPNYCVIKQHPELMNLNYKVGLPDWIHLNGIDYNEELDQIILSTHQKNEIWIIDHSTTMAEAATHKGGKYGRGGDFLYRWGNPEAYNAGTHNDQTLFRQHNPHWIPKGMKNGGEIMIFNNSAERDPFCSAVEIISPPQDAPGFYKQTVPFGPAKAKWSYKDSIPSRFFAFHISGAQRLSNGNTLICDGVKGKFFEIDKNNKTVWEYVNPVSTGDTIMIDGVKPDRNKVFKCIYYSSDYGAFVGRDIKPELPIEIMAKPSNCYINVPKKRKCNLLRRN